MHAQDILGTRSSAPEYRCGGIPGPRSDQLSVALLAHKMLTGKRPYGGNLINTMTLKDLQNLTINQR